MGHVNNAVYLTYLEQARLVQWRSVSQFGGLRNMREGQTEAPGDPLRDVPGVILARVEIDYKRPARYGDLLDVRIGLASIGRTSFTYEYEIVDTSDRLVAGARSVQVFYDYRAGTPMPIPDDLRRVFDTL